MRKSRGEEIKLGNLRLKKAGSRAPVRERDQRICWQKGCGAYERKQEGTEYRSI